MTATSSLVITPSPSMIGKGTKSSKKATGVVERKTISSAQRGGRGKISKNSKSSEITKLRKRAQLIETDFFGQPSIGGNNRCTNLEREIQHLKGVIAKVYNKDEAKQAKKASNKQLKTKVLH